VNENRNSTGNDKSKLACVSFCRPCRSNEYVVYSNKLATCRVDKVINTWKDLLTLRPANIVNSSSVNI